MNIVATKLHAAYLPGRRASEYGCRRDFLEYASDALNLHFMNGITLFLIAFFLMRKPFANSEQLLQLHTWGDHISVYYLSRIIRPGKVLTCFGALLTARINWVSRNQWLDAGVCRQVAFKTLSVNCIGKFYH